jgi:hypothetical protein
MFGIDSFNASVLSSNLKKMQTIYRWISSKSSRWVNIDFWQTHAGQRNPSSSKDG